MTDDGGWVSLFSGGKDSAWALYRALERGFPVARLLTVHAGTGSAVYHVPATALADLAADSIGIDLVEVDLDAAGAGHADVGARGDAEIEPLERALRALDARLDGGLAGVIVGAVESEFQAGRVEAVCDRLDVDLFAPLWHRDPRTLADAMLDAGFEIVVVAVAARGLDEPWLGRTLDADAFDELEVLHEEYGVHVLGEGGGFETLVTAGPHMDQRLELDYETEWDGVRGQLRITDAWLEPR